MNKLTRKKINDIDDLMKPQIEKAFNRWQDEMKYEPWADYQKFLADCFSDARATTGHDAKLKRISKKRKGNLIEVHFEFEGHAITLACTKTQYQWKGYEL